jgi:glycosyltransferase involved in cell wall biosynthesis
MIICNARVLDNKLTGAQRYLSELSSRLVGEVELIRPQRSLHGVSGHMWEQFVLPRKIGTSLLWSPSITGPLSVENQVVTIFDVVPLDHPEWNNTRFALWYQYIIPRLVNRVRRILVISEFTKNRLIDHFPNIESKIEVIYLAANESFVPSDRVSINKTREILGIPSANYIVALGSLEPRKNISRLLKAWDSIQSKLPDDVWLILAGGKGKSNVFRNVSMEKLPARVHLTGHIDDSLLPSLYSGAIASVYPSLYEGFGLPPLEAMSCGTPVLTSNISSLPEVVGSAALKVDPLDCEAIGHALTRLIDDPSLRLRLSILGLEQSRKFSWDITAQKTLSALKGACD